MPVSRKRKKSHKSTVAARAERRRLHTRQVQLTNSLRAIAGAQEEGQAKRVELARPHAADLAGLLLGSRLTGTALEDEICALLGPLLARLGDLPMEGYVGPDHLATALIDDLRERAEPGERAGEVLRAVAAIMPMPLRSGAGIEPAAPETAGEVRWTRDRYGSRFAIIAPFSTPEGPVRWYLWDVDACDFTPRPEHAGFYASPEEALAAWQVAAGAAAAGGTSWRRIDDSRLLAGLLPGPEEYGPLGGETAGQFAEYHRCRRLAEVVLEMPRVLAFDPVETALDAGPKAFAAWLRTAPDRPEPDIFLVEELFDMWPSSVPELFDSCSPHRARAVAEQIRDEFRDAADDLLDLLPFWVTWLAERSGLPAELRDRSLENC
ncbi:hypothetical protein [Actinoplanes couchii]|uniref:Uncharacterized protein n=1 Tax=Actinoplanes couchii TaxID=403638 RepID=A0ABQ3XF33_9ACTN|nr:hypothetical protein [Actinoplanes couchii]MDR6321929.1 hypothetical protein [Actinoplanes couchii]GID57115.1 hypothetical protein Aco03nite_055190 [Actinoplanes couchii]